MKNVTVRKFPNRYIKFRWQQHLWYEQIICRVRIEVVISGTNVLYRRRFNYFLKNNNTILLESDAKAIF